MTEMTARACDSFTQRIWMAGNYANAEEICRTFCERGMCVSIHPTNYIYTGGEESGFCVTLINYARFPKDYVSLKDLAFELAMDLMKGLHQQSFSIENPSETLFFSKRPEDQTPNVVTQPPVRNHDDPWTEQDNPWQGR